MEQVERKSKGGMTAVMWLGFAGPLSSSCVGFMTFAVPIRHGCTTHDFITAFLKSQFPF